MLEKAGKNTRRYRVWAFGLVPLLLFSALWALVHRVGGAGAWVADTLRTALGDRAVADLEDGVYGAVDRVNQWRYAGERPTPRWQVAPAAVEPEEGLAERTGVPAPVQPPPFHPEDVGPLFRDMSADGDGVWVPVEPSNQRSITPLGFKTLVHPDRTRSWSELAVVALDLDRISLHAVAGSAEPLSEAPGAEAYVRTARVAPEHEEALLLAFNGGFKTRHGHHGMGVGGTTLVSAKDDLCTIAGYEEGRVRVASWQALAGTDPIWWRQTARCLVENGKRHPRLVQELTTSWGAAVGGETVIRRSALGISEDGKTLFVGVANSVTAPALADGMRHVGAHHVAQLDVNHAFPRILVYQTDAGTGELRPKPIIEGLVYSHGHYLRERSSRDFFYVTERADRVVRRFPEASGHAG